MVNKIYFRTSFLSLLSQLFCFLMLSADVYFLIPCTIGFFAPWDGKFSFLNIIVGIILYIGIPIVLSMWSFFVCGLIRLDSTRIYNRGSFGKNKTQYPASVDFIDISSISVEPLRKKSNGQSDNSIRPIAYLCVHTKQDKVILFALHFMSARTVRKLIAELAKRCDNVGNKIELDIDNLIKDFWNARLAVEERSDKK